MNSHQALNAYRNVGIQSSVNDASPHQLISMLLDGAIGRVASAKGAMERKEINRQGELLSSAINIIDNMRASLDHQAGGELAANLSALYDYLERRLLEARTTGEAGMLDEVNGLLHEIKSGWDAIPAEHRRG